MDKNNFIAIGLHEPANKKIKNLFRATIVVLIFFSSVLMSSSSALIGFAMIGGALGGLFSFAELSLEQGHIETEASSRSLIFYSGKIILGGGAGFVAGAFLSYYFKYFFMPSGVAGQGNLDANLLFVAAGMVAGGVPSFFNNFLVAFSKRKEFASR